MFCLAIILVVTNNQPTFAKAYFASLKEMVERSDTIAVANLGPIKTIKEKGKTFNYSQESQATVLEAIKGSLPKKIVIRGGEDFICAQVQLVEGKSLLFLNKENDYFKGANWQNSCVAIKNNTVHWYKNAEEHFPAVDTNLDKAIKDVKALIAGKDIKIESSMKLPDYLETLLNAKEFADHIIGEAPKEKPQWLAYEKAKTESDKIKKELLYLTEHATPAGKLYAACALMSCDSKLSLSILGKMKDKKEEVLYLSGCRGMNGTLGEIATSLVETGKYLNFKLASK